MITQFTNKFTSDNIPKVFLSPYTGIDYMRSGIILHHTIKSQKYFIAGHPDRLLELFNRLKSGIEYPSLIAMVNEYVAQNHAEDWIADCFQKGILE